VHERPLHQAFEESARRRPDHVAVEEPGAGSITYAELAALSDAVRDRLRRLGVRPGDRVGFCLRKSIDGIATILGVLKAGAAYVPVDPGAPLARAAYILDNCSVAAAVTEQRFAEGLQAELAKLGGVPPILVLEGVGAGRHLRAALEREQAKDPAPPAATASPGPDDLAYILYTSGSTGKPKGVMLSQRNATSFVDWCSETFAPTEDDRFSSHAPFHFDLSILDIYVPLKHGATLVLIAEEVGKEPVRLAPAIAEARISVWYSAPSILGLLAQYGNLPRHDYSTLRTVLFAGEVFPVKHLRALKALWPRPRYFNLYGPTETNVCTWYEIPAEVPESRSEPYPIGVACSHLRTRVVDERSADVAKGQEGELVVAGPGVMGGYWSLPENTARAFLTDAAGERWYRTGDIVIEEPGGDYKFVGRRDRMVKKRGYRVELGEIEAALYRHPLVREAAVISLADEVNGVRVKAFLSCRGEKNPSLIELKRFCVDNLPNYMILDLFSFQDALPKTSTDKIDYQRLKQVE
jgi:amino acid adenylation domain-containing protein